MCVWGGGGGCDVMNGFKDKTIQTSNYSLDDLNHFTPEKNNTFHELHHSSTRQKCVNAESQGGFRMLPTHWPSTLFTKYFCKPVQSILTPVRSSCSCRYGAAELHSVAAYMGGVAAQEVIKVLTQQFVPVNNTFIYNAMKQTSVTLEM